MKKLKELARYIRHEWGFHVNIRVESGRCIVNGLGGISGLTTIPIVILQLPKEHKYAISEALAFMIHEFGHCILNVQGKYYKSFICEEKRAWIIGYENTPSKYIPQNYFKVMTKAINSHKQGLKKKNLKYRRSWLYG